MRRSEGLVGPGLMHRAWTGEQASDEQQEKVMRPHRFDVANPLQSYACSQKPPLRQLAFIKPGLLLTVPGLSPSTVLITSHIPETHTMQGQPLMPASDAPHPFNQRSADVILRTSDSISFHVHTQILSQASPVFATMFELPQPSPEAPGVATLVRPVIDVSEDSKALEPLLRLCYPVKKAILRQPEDIRPVLEAAIKYDMEWPTEALTRTLTACAPHGPLQVWAIGCRLGLERVARRGAEVFAGSIPVGEREQLILVPRIARILGKMEGISAGQYHRLLQFLRSAEGVEEMEGQMSDRVGEMDSIGRADGNAARIALLDVPFALETTLSQSERDQASIRRAFRFLPFANDGFASIAYPAEGVPAPDIICRCVDGMEFKAHQSILSLWSPVWSARIVAINTTKVGYHPGPPEPHPWDVTPVLELEYSSFTIATLLGICYHQQTQLPTARRDCIDLLAAATKYKIQHVVDLALACWSSLAPRHELYSYFLAHQMGIPAAMTIAAVKSLEHPGAALVHPAQYVEIMEEVPARTYHQILVYHDACSRAVIKALDRGARAWKADTQAKTPVMWTTSDGRCRPHDANGVDQLRIAVRSWLPQLQDGLKKHTIAPKAGHVGSLRKLEAAVGWNGSTTSVLQRLMDIISREIEATIDKVSSHDPHVVTTLIKLTQVKLNL
ncbi:hypothetical protein BD309DRAFT_980292 [Dichomitus squalens]|nr:hypothetical protein BD309DRAFT_980292 [Dichomitus squalens]